MNMLLAEGDIVVTWPVVGLAAVCGAALVGYIWALTR